MYKFHDNLAGLKFGCQPFWNIFKAHLEISKYLKLKG